jgi:Ca2+-binding EF-hand superfamily protein
MWWRHYNAYFFHRFDQVNVFDADHSGKIDFTEFLIAVSTSSHGNIKQKLRLGFKLYDTNNNGKIDKKEMVKLIEAIYDLNGETNRKGDNEPKNRVEAIFNKLDRDQNGTIDVSCLSFSRMTFFRPVFKVILLIILKGE